MTTRRSRGVSSADEPTDGGPDSMSEEHVFGQLLELLTSEPRPTCLTNDALERGLAHMAHCESCRAGFAVLQSLKRRDDLRAFRLRAQQAPLEDESDNDEPSPAELAEYADLLSSAMRELAAQEMPDIAKHVAGCAACQEVIEAITGTPVPPSGKVAHGSPPPAGPTPATPAATSGPDEAGRSRIAADPPIRVEIETAPVASQGHISVASWKATQIEGAFVLQLPAPIVVQVWPQAALLVSAPDGVVASVMSKLVDVARSQGGGEIDDAAEDRWSSPLAGEYSKRDLVDGRVLGTSHLTVDLCDDRARSPSWVQVQVELRSEHGKQMIAYIWMHRVSADNPEGEAVAGIVCEAAELLPDGTRLRIDRSVTTEEGKVSLDLKDPKPVPVALIFRVDDRDWVVPLDLKTEKRKRRQPPIAHLPPRDRVTHSQPAPENPPSDEKRADQDRK